LLYNPIKKVDDFLNKVTMYKLVLHFLSLLLAVAVILSSLEKLSFAPHALLYSAFVLLIVSYLVSKLFSKIWNVRTNLESTYISALILAFIISPPANGQFYLVLPLLIWASIWSVAVKYILVIWKKHIFNPVAFSVALTALTIHQSASWWIGTAWMLPFVLIGGLFIIHKIRRFDLVLSFLITALLMIVIGSLGKTNIFALLRQIFVDSPLIFFASVMLTEPLTTPPTRVKRMIYGAFTGLIYAPFIHIGSVYSTPELALCLGNIVSWIMSPKRKYVLTLKSKDKIARDTGEFVFSSPCKIKFKPGQYMEWTLAHRNPDNRGYRRYFTIASSPTESDIILGIKFDTKRSSSFKKSLAELEEGKTLVAGQLAGDFTLPKNRDEKLCFIAGGIGITPFRSMVTYMVDKNEKRDVVLVYSCKRIEELAYTNLFHHAHTHLGLKTVSTLTDLDRIPEDWNGYKGFVGVELLLQEIPDYAERTFYVSGPPSLVDAVKKILTELGIDKKRIKTDYFPGF